MRKRRINVLNKKYTVAYHMKTIKGGKLIVTKRNYVIKCFINY